jgi:hypothetical protein
MMSRRLLALTLAASLGAGSTILAQGNLSESVSRAVQAMEQQQGLSGPNARTTVASEPLAARLDPARREAQQRGGTEPLSKSKMGKKTKALIYLAIGAVLGTTAFEIDRHVADVTPSHLGTRQDDCKVFLLGCGN